MNSILTNQSIPTIPMFAPVLARMFTTLPFPCYPSSTGQFPTYRDGTDPLFGGHRGGSGDHHVPTTRRGGAA